MSGPALARSTMRFGTRFGLAAITLLVLGPFINRNFGIGDSSNFLQLPEMWESAPVAVLVSLAYLTVLVSCVLLSIALVTASLVIRHAENRADTLPTGGTSSGAW